jgi:hypothetical protein
MARAVIAGDFSTPEQSTQATKGDWESCMTMNDSWGYATGDNNWKSSHHLIQNLVECSAGWRELSAQYRAQGRWLCAGAQCPHPGRSGAVAGKERRGNLRHRQVPILAWGYLRFHAQREHVVHSRLFLAGANGHRRRSEDQCTVGETAGQQCRRSFYAKGTSTDLLASARPGTGPSGDGHPSRVRVRTGPGCALVSCRFTAALLSYSY